MSKELISLLVMLPFYGVAFFMIARTLVVAFSFRDPVPFVPIGGKLLDRSIELLNLNPGDRVVDLGSGSGKMLFKAAKKYPEVDFVGVDINRVLIAWSKLKARLLGVQNISFIHSDVYEFDVSDFNRVYMYMTSTFASEIIEKKLKEELPKGSIVLSVAFGFSQEFKENNSVETYEVDISNKYNMIDIWRKGG